MFTLGNVQFYTYTYYNGTLYKNTNFPYTLNVMFIFYKELKVKGDGFQCFRFRNRFFSFLIPTIT